MSFAAALRSQIEASLADRIPSALTPAAKTIREVVSTGIAAIDTVLDGGFPVGAVTELIGAECSVTLATWFGPLRRFVLAHPLGR
jgi:RecA/RadA recombinase